MVSDSSRASRAVVYARYSSHSQQDQSIDGQLRDAYEWADRNGVQIIKEYIDRAHTARTGHTDDRAAFRQMMEDAKSKAFSLIIVWKLDRFARSRYDSAVNKARLSMLGVRVVSIKEQITDSPEGIIMEGMLEAMAEYYSANLSQNIKRGQRETAMKGRFCGGKVPYGYRLQDGHLVADEATAPIIRAVFAKYAEGCSKKEIFSGLSAMGITGGGGAPLSASSFAHALSSETYVGRYHYNGQLIPGLAEALIDEDTFARVQQRILQHAHAPSAGRGEVRYLLQGKLYCGHCGATMRGMSGKARNGDKHYYYACSERRISHTCQKSHERKDPLEAYVIRCTLDWIRSPVHVREIAQDVVALYEKEYGSSAAAPLEKAIARLDQQLTSLVDALADAPKAGRPKIYEKMEAIGEQKKELEAQLSDVRIAQRARLTVQDVISWINDFSRGDPLDPRFTQRLIDIFINSVYVYDHRLVIFYNIRQGDHLTFSDLPSSLSGPSDDAAAPAASPGSSLSASAPPNVGNGEPLIVFVNGVLGCIFSWGRKEG